MMLRSGLKTYQRKVLQELSRSYKTSGIPELTQERHNVKRGNYAVLTDKDVGFFESVVGSNHTVKEKDELQSYNVDFLRSVRGDSQLVLKPGSVEEVSTILKYCNDNKIAVCPQGGNTGLVGGSVPVCDEIVLSLQRLNKVISIDEVTGIAVCEAGCILDTLENHAREVGLVVPIDLGAKQSCHVGGNLSTNAGGLRVLRYGNLHGSCLGVEAVLANGQVLDLMSDFKKDNTGYHLKHLFIGSEGTLGIITKLALLCPPAPKAVHVAFLGISSFDDVLKTFVAAKRHLGEILSSCEMLDAASLAASLEHFDAKSPVDGYPFYMLIETSGSNETHDEEKFNKFLEIGMESGEICDGTITSDPSKIKEIWSLRERVPLALIKDGYCFKYDISLPLRRFYEIVPVLKERVGDLSHRVCGYGHLGDSNLHLNVSCKEYSAELYKAIEPFVFEYTSKLKGSVSAEHGIGFLKTKYLGFSKTQNAIDMMKNIKHLLDPNGILNPYKVLQNH
ncbi:D-2-hydroxyglutarate dehydrogenase, mitochondrial isoform X1 [Episyrphus balteatus]|uniref:D-2-hydroxyglutarate dehydrogenase, mitochondrial isoform X1 n=1 Tax=Episyrphus balteatus TaxID=286459 RepID=UPI0024864E5D|nr:D-2-hydroxyglutarate dehydrogenase, mitochondrial isoform X1 [Episyrphus balteatus]XP_055846276.1 D-2-hydroxyglutarate dehydrogenase, mitochondrial isoform X1 [Episyrphus balteatus]XP_055846278.1 D-2-hydroxyglutarate dehydrogenase, mitochondrial isoform X1 [Episyrphus balteatus]XP_055846279.1 D-2-hydroxyglutarate dehydrogenase, mitochondrial isoform X1 [Episyrphus balteatus]